MNDIIKIIDVLRSADFYGAGKFTEIAKGKREMISDVDTFKTKVKRILKNK